jgi:hypothetical protein
MDDGPDFKRGRKCEIHERFRFNLASVHHVQSGSLWIRPILGHTYIRNTNSSRDKRRGGEDGGKNLLHLLCFPTDLDSVNVLSAESIFGFEQKVEWSTARRETNSRDKQKNMKIDFGPKWQADFSVFLFQSSWIVKKGNYAKQRSQLWSRLGFLMSFEWTGFSPVMLT